MTRNELTPEDAAELYIDDKRSDGLSDKTIQSYRAHLRYVLNWLQDAHSDVETVREMDGLILKEYKSGHAHHASGTLHNRLRTTREMLEFSASVGAHDHETVDAIELKRPQDTRSGTVEPETAGKILDRLDTYQYASRAHVLMCLLWRTGVRLGDVHSLDVSDVDHGPPALTVEHRPPETTLKNGEERESPIGLSERTAAVIADYVEHNRIEPGTDGRDALLTTDHGRAAKNTLRHTLYVLTRPCWYGDDCPDGKDPEDCDAAGPKHAASGCPHNNSPHDVRRGRITDYRRRAVPKAVISDRCDVSVPVLEQHYNQMTDEEKMEQRREYL